MSTFDRCILSPRNRSGSLAWIKFAEGHLEGGLEQMNVFFIKEALDLILAHMAGISSVVSVVPDAPSSLRTVTEHSLRDAFVCVVCFFLQ